MTSGTITNKNINPRETLDLSRPDDLRTFLTSARSVYDVARQFESMARAEAYSGLAMTDVGGDEIFLTLHQLWGDLQRDTRRAQMMVEDGTILTDQVVERLQHLYNDLLILRNYIASVYASVKRTESTTNRRTRNRREKEKTKRQPEKKLSEEGVSAVYDEIERLVEATKKNLQATKARIFNQLSVADSSATSRQEIDTLDQLLGKVKMLEERLAGSRRTVRDLTVLQEVQAKYVAILEQITEQADEVESDLRQRLQSITTGVSVVPAPVETIPAVKTPVDAKGMTGSVAVENEQLIREVRYNPFLTQTELAMAEELYQTVSESLTLERSPSVCDDRLSVFRSYVKSLTVTPALAELTGRVARIMRRITASLSYESDTLRTARMLERKFRDMYANTTKTDQEKLAAYHMLEEYVISHESEWLTICGVGIPVAGEAGVSQARKMREALLMERDRNQEFIQNPRKQLMVDKLIRKLSFIPPDGFDEADDLLEIKNLVRAIDVSGQQVDHHSQVEEESGETLGVQTPQHHTLPINGDDDTADLAIRVALRSSRRSKAKNRQKTVAAEAASPTAQLVEEVPLPGQTGVVAALERKDPVRSAVPSLTPRFFPPAPAHEKRSLIQLYLQSQLYQEFIAEHYTSTDAFERILDTIVTQIESKTSDVFERWLGEEKASAFLFLEEQTVNEVLELAGNPDVRQILTEQNIKYETFLAWVDLIDEMQAVVGEDLSLCFGELYARWVIESEMIFASEST